MKSIVDNIIILLSAKSIDLSPYKYSMYWFAKFNRLYFCNMSFTLVTKITLWVAYKGHMRRKWFVSSLPLWHLQLARGVSRKPWLFLWLLRGLRPTLRKNRCRSPTGSWILNIDFFPGRMRDRRWFLRILIDGTLGKKVMILFQAFIPS